MHIVKLRPDMPEGFIKNDEIPELPALVDYLTPYNNQLLSTEDIQGMLETSSSCFEDMPVHNNGIRGGLYLRELDENRKAISCLSDDMPGILGFGLLEKVHSIKFYIEINQAAYDTLAPEYQDRWTQYITSQKEIMQPFERLLVESFNAPIYVLDVGCGVGLDSYILTQDGFKVHGIDISENMLKFARQNVPGATFEQTGILDYFGALSQGIVMNAFLHLFPERDIPNVLNRAKSLLIPRGYMLISTTKNDMLGEGFLRKDDYAMAGGITRFRRRYTRQGLVGILEQNGLTVVEFNESFNALTKKAWMNLIAKFAG